jgi:hypothetical protein
MSTLPVLDLPEHKIKLPISEETVQIRPFVIKQEKSLLSSLDDDLKNNIEIFKKLVKGCVIGEIDPNELNLVDFFYLVITIRAKSNGEIVQAKVPCDYCEKKSEFEFDIEKAIKLKNKDNKTINCKITDDLSLKLVLPKIQDINFNDFENTENVLDFIASHIDTVIYQEQIYNKFTKEELIENIIGNLAQKDIKKISENIDKLAKLYLEVEFTCNSCQKINKFETEDIMDFL